MSLPKTPKVPPPPPRIAGAPNAGKASFRVPTPAAMAGAAMAPAAALAPSRTQGGTAPHETTVSTPTSGIRQISELETQAPGFAPVDLDMDVEIEIEEVEEETRPSLLSAPTRPSRLEMIFDPRFAASAEDDDE